MKKKYPLTVIQNDTCFAAHERLNLSCKKESCRCWFDNLDSKNCVNITAKKGPEKQERIGDYFGLTRMRVCQIEKTILKNIRKDNDLGTLI